MEMKENEIISSEGVPKTISLKVLQTIKEAQRQHGIRHSDYQRYRQYCSRKLGRVRKVISFPQGSKNKVQGRMIPAELVKEHKCLMIPLMNAERCWAYSMQLKFEGNTERRKIFHMKARLAKAVKHAEHLQNVAVNGAVSCDARTILEIKAYCAWMKGLLSFECQEWKEALELFSTSKLICEKLCEALVGEGREVYVLRCDEMSPNIKYCEYIIGGDASAMDELVKMRLHVGIQDPLTSKLDELIEKTRKKESSGVMEVSWLDRKVLVKVELVRKAILSVVEGEKEGKSVKEGEEEERLLMLEGILKEVIDAQQALKDDNKDDLGIKDVCSKTALSDKRLSDAAYLFTYLVFLRQCTSIHRSLLMISIMKKESKAKSQDMARLYDVVIQNVCEMASCVAMQEMMLQHLNQISTAYKAFKCFYLADVMNGLRRYNDSMALYQRCLTYASQYTPPDTQLHPLLHPITPSSLQVRELSEEAEVLKYSSHASCILNNNLPSPPPTNAIHHKPLVERLGEYKSNRRLIDLPPSFQPTPAKPFFFDLALSMMEFPPLDHLMQQKQSQSGITGYFKKLIWGGGDKENN